MDSLLMGKFLLSLYTSHLPRCTSHYRHTSPSIALLLYSLFSLFSSQTFSFYNKLSYTIFSCLSLPPDVSHVRVCTFTCLYLPIYIVIYPCCHSLLVWLWVLHLYIQITSLFLARYHLPASYTTSVVPPKNSFFFFYFLLLKILIHFCFCLPGYSLLLTFCVSSLGHLFLIWPLSL